MWTYYRQTGNLQSTTNASVCTGYSGFGEGKNDPSMSDVHNVGPLPAGMYTICEPHDDAQVGPYAMRLTPDAANEMFGRGDFLIHGDSFTHPGAASHGCVIIPRWARTQIWDSGEHTLVVI